MNSEGSITRRDFVKAASLATTASALQLHPHCQVIVDEEAAAELQGKDYYRWIFEHEPEWAEYR